GRHAHRSVAVSQHIAYIFGCGGAELSTQVSWRSMGSDRAELLGVPDAAIAKGVHQETVRRAIRAGRLPALRIGRSFAIRPADLRAWQPRYEKAPGRPADRGAPPTLAAGRLDAQHGRSPARPPRRLRMRSNEGT